MIFLDKLKKSYYHVKVNSYFLAKEMTYVKTKKIKLLLDEVRDYMRLKHYSIHTERTYCDWIKRFGHFHSMSSRDDLKDGEQKIEAFLTHLASKTKCCSGHTESGHECPCFSL